MGECRSNCEGERLEFEGKQREEETKRRGGRKRRRTSEEVKLDYKYKRHIQFFL